MTVEKIVLDGGRVYDRGSKGLEAKAIDAHLTAPYAPQVHERAEQMISTKNNRIWTLLIQAGAPASVWSECLYNVFDASNRVAYQGCAKRPEELVNRQEAECRTFVDLLAAMFVHVSWTGSVKHWTRMQRLLFSRDV